MLQGSPSFTKAAPLRPLEFGSESTNPSGIVLAKSLAPVAEVVLECSAALRIVKHARDAAPQRVFGSLLGIQVGATIEIQTALPSVQTQSYATDLTEEEQAKRDAADERSTLEFYRQTQMGSFNVGQYTGASHSSYLTTRNLKAMMRGKESGTPCLMLVYDPARTVMGKLYIRAFAPTDNYAAYTASEKGESGGDVTLQNVAQSGLLREIPVRLTASTLNQLFLHQYVASVPRGVENSMMAQGGVEKYTERMLQVLSEGSEKLKYDLVQRNYSGSTAGPTPLRVDSLVLVQQLHQQSAHLVGLSKSGIASLNFANQIPTRGSE